MKKMVLSSAKFPVEAEADIPDYNGEAVAADVR
jgi:hypothetical protein